MVPSAVTASDSPSGEWAPLYVGKHDPGSSTTVLQALSK